MTTEDIGALIAVCTFACLAVDVYVFRSEPPWMDAWNFWYGIVVVPAAVLAGAWFLVHGSTGMAGAEFLYAAGAFAVWWRERNNRKRRKKVADRASGVVMDVGGRLKVAYERLAQ